MRARPDAQALSLHIAGDGPDRASLEELAETAAPGRVVFHGRLRRDQLVEMLRSALVSVVPSRWYENQPLSVLESFASAVPVIGSRLGGLPDLIQDGKTGRLVPHDDVPALAAALTELAADPVSAHAMGGRARALAESRFSPETHMSAVTNVYRESQREVVSV
jgi:glycosyltransferase involved in cell wall biosynthesis